MLKRIISEAAANKKIILAAVYDYFVKSRNVVWMLHKLF